MPVGLRAHSHDGCVQPASAGRAVEGDVETEHASVGRDQPVAAGLGVGAHSHDRLVESQVAGGAVEGGVTEVEDASSAATSQ